MEEETLLFNKTLKKIEILFGLAGIYISCGVRKTSSRFKCRCIYIFNCLLASQDLIGSIFWCIQGVRTGKDFLEITYSAPCISISVLAQFKAIFLIRNEEHVKTLINSLRKLEMKEKQRKQSPEKDQIVTEDTKFLNFVLKTLTILYVALIVAFALNPMVLIAIKYYQTKEIELVLPFLIIYGFDPYQIKVWPFVFLHQFLSEIVVCLDICSADFFFFTCCTFIRIQFRLLQQELQNIIPKANANRKFVEDEEFRNNFKDLIKWHQDLIEAVDILEIIYSKSTLLNFISSSLIICLTGFNVTMMIGDVAFVVTFMSFLFVSLVQVFFLCFFADLLMTSSMEISNAAYNSLWYMAEPKIGKMFLLVMTRSQKPCKITASGFADVSLNSFMRVLSTAWSYFALLQTMYGD